MMKSLEKSVLAIFVLSLFIILVFSLVAANSLNGNPHRDDKKNDSNHYNENSTENKTIKMNYGLCVANYTKVKNDCYKLAKDNFSACKLNVLNISKTDLDQAGKNITQRKEIIINKRVMLANCRDQYHDEIDVCKASFKSNKESCIQYRCKVNQTVVNGTCMF